MALADPDVASQVEAYRRAVARIAKLDALAASKRAELKALRKQGANATMLTRGLQLENAIALLHREAKQLWQQNDLRRVQLHAIRLKRVEQNGSVKCYRAGALPAEAATDARQWWFGACTQSRSCSLPVVPSWATSRVVCRRSILRPSTGICCPRCCQRRS